MPSWACRSSPPRCSACSREDFSILYQDTDAGPWDMGSSGSQTTFNNGRAVIAAATEVREQLLDMAAKELEAARADLELAEGTIRVKGSPDRRVTIVDLAGSGTPLLGKGSGDVPEAAPSDIASHCIGGLGLESFLAPQLITHAAHVQGRPRDRRRPRAAVSPRRTTRAGSSTGSVPTGRCTAAS